MMLFNEQISKGKMKRDHSLCKTGPNVTDKNVLAIRPNNPFRHLKAIGFF